MKVVIATPLYPPEIGGPATYVKELEEGLPSYGIDVIVVKFSDVRRWPKLLRHYLYYRKILAVANNADAILALDPVSVGLPAMKASKALKKPFVVKIAGDYAWEQGVQRFGVKQNLDDFVKTEQPSLFVRKLQAVEARAAAAATRVIVPSEYLKGIVTEWRSPSQGFGGPSIQPEKIKVIYNGIELPSHIPTYQKNDGEFLIVSAGRRVPWKGFEAIENVARKHKNWRVFIASGLARAETLGWIKTADVFVLNSQYEGLSHALIEAMSLGTPVVATDVGGNPELIRDGETGLLIPAGDDEALRIALARIAEDPVDAHEKAMAAQEHIRHFSVTAMIDATAKLLKNL